MYLFTVRFVNVPLVADVLVPFIVVKFPSVASTLPLVLVMTAVVAANDNALKVFETEKLVLEASPRVEVLEFILFVVRFVYNLNISSVL